jgi:hypothetical protein
MSQGFQRGIICDFWAYRSKVMIFQRLGSNLIRKTYLNSILVQTGPRGAIGFAGTASGGSVM